MIMILLANATRHAEGVKKKTARLGHAANCIFAGAPARVMLPLAVLVRILGEAYCYTIAYYIRRAKTCWIPIHHASIQPAYPQAT